MKCGDAKSKAFHQAVNGRRKKNEVNRLLGEDREWHDATSAVNDVLVKYFKKLFFSDQGSKEEVIEAFIARVTKQHNFLYYMSL